MMSWRFTVELDADRPEAIEMALWSLEETRRRTLSYIKGVDQATLDYNPPGQRHGIATLLYHIAVFEADWLYVDILDRGYMERQIPNCPDAVASHLPYPLLMEDRAYTPVAGDILETHLERLVVVRAALFETLGQMTLAEFRKSRVSDDTLITPEGVAQHLVQHESEHRGQIWEARAAAESDLGIAVLERPT